MPTVFSTLSPLERYGHNLTALAQQGTFAPLAGQDAVIDRIFQVLSRKNKSNPLILDLDETRRFAIIAEVVRRMATGEAPDPFSRQQVIALDIEALFQNPSDDALSRQKRLKLQQTSLEEKFVQGENESEEEWLERVGEIPLWPQLEEWVAPNLPLERLQSVFIAMRQVPGSYLLFVDHFHRLVAGECDTYPIDAATLLKPALARDHIQLIGTCTLEQYRRHIERDAAIRWRFQEVILPL